MLFNLTYNISVITVNMCAYSVISMWCCFLSILVLCLCMVLMFLDICHVYCVHDGFYEFAELFYLFFVC